MKERVYDVVIIGGGIVGLAALRDLCLWYDGLSVLLLERDDHLCGQASGHNSGILCTGYDAPKDSLERRMLKEANCMYEEIWGAAGIPMEHTGALVVAWNEGEMEGLRKVVDECIDAGDKGSKIISQCELREREPLVSSLALGAALVPGEVVVDPFMVPMSYAAAAEEHGGTIRFSSEVIAAQPSSDEGVGWELLLNGGVRVQAKTVINAAGCFGDRVESMMRHPGSISSFTSLPRKGDYIVFEPSPSHQGTLTAPIQPVPNDRTKGVYLFRSSHGLIACGPTAVDVDVFEDVSVSDEAAAELKAHALRVMPSLSEGRIVGRYAGLRPATDKRDYQIGESKHAKGLVNACGIRSTGLSASLAIGRLVATTAVGILERTWAGLLSDSLVRRQTAKFCRAMPSVQDLVDSLQVLRGHREGDDGGDTQTEQVYVTIHGVERRVSHPLTMWGLMRRAGVQLRGDDVAQHLSD